MSPARRAAPVAPGSAVLRRGGPERTHLVAAPVDVERIRRAERELAVQLPAELVARLLRENGGEITAPPEGSGERRGARLARVPAGRGAHPGNGTGDRLIVTAGGSIRLWDHETGETVPVRVDWS
jgi:hypothetical protein